MLQNVGADRFVWLLRDTSFLTDADGIHGIGYKFLLTLPVTQVEVSLSSNTSRIAKEHNFTTQPGSIHAHSHGERHPHVP